MRIGTYNILRFQGYPGGAAAAALGDAESSERIDHFVRVFRELDCDILALQEGGVSAAMMQHIAQALDMYLVTIPSPVRWPGQILSRFPVTESRVFSHVVPDASAVPPLSRCAGAARLQLGTEEDLWVFVLHLHPHDRALRRTEAQIIAERVRELVADCPNVVVLGDFNCTVEEPVHRYLMDLGFVNAMEAVGGGLRPTVDTAGIRFNKAIDHIYVSPSMASRLHYARVIETEGFRHDEPRQPGAWDHSDHLPVLCELR